MCQGHSHRSSFELDPIDEEAEGKHFKQKGSGLILAKYFGGWGIGRKMEFGPKRVWYSITFFFSWNNTTCIASFLESGLGLEFASCGKIDRVPVQGLCIKRPVFCVHESSEQPDKYNYLVEEITWRVHLEIEKGPETTWGEIEGGSYKLNSQLPVNQDYSKTSRTVKLSPVQMRTEWLFF